MRVECACDNAYTEPHLPGCPVLLDNLERASGADQDPAVRTWGESLAASTDQAASTSALLRRLNGELDRLREQYNAVLLERDELAAEVKRLTARHARTYQLTDKGRAATTEETS